uniref:Uncharacterized protein n=1 Tax=Arundo donax TaxID=35708 RepID=A0A0A8Z8C0_ARUDO
MNGVRLLATVGEGDSRHGLYVSPSKHH